MVAMMRAAAKATGTSDVQPTRRPSHLVVIYPPLPAAGNPPAEPAAQAESDHEVTYVTAEQGVLRKERSGNITALRI
jgi:hypothetical protein